ncbi:MlaD family protein [Flavobacterium sp. UBA7663]|uniref:MlaD family protein n=1 Tax=Flavobacterium sp. UBA7663 TaxID=1946557 RepID=UPI0025BBFA6F|nr:MlaD family protein [Flavobacterium sp. UBA7663]
MKLTKEIKTAILVIVSIFLFIWGYNFLKGKDLFDSSTRVYVVYDNVAGLVNSAPVTLNGLSIGKVNSITIQPDGKLLVEMQITTDFPIAKSSVAEIYDSGLVGGRQIAIKPNFQDKDYIKTGDYLKASSKLGLTDALAQQLEPLQYKVQKLLDNADVLFTNVNEILDERTKQNLKNSIAELNKTLSEFSVASKNINEMIADNKLKINSTMTNFDKTAANFSKMSDSLAKANLGQTVKNLEKTLANVDKIMTDIEQGKGTIGKLMKDDAMYNNFTNTSKELELLLQDVRLNPTRYVNVSVFGKKNKPYVAPVNDTIKK